MNDHQASETESEEIQFIPMIGKSYNGTVHIPKSSPSDVRRAIFNALFSNTYQTMKVPQSLRHLDWFELVVLCTGNDHPSMTLCQPPSKIRHLYTSDPEEEPVPPANNLPFVPYDAVADDGHLILASPMSTQEYRSTCDK